MPKRKLMCESLPTFWTTSLFSKLDTDVLRRVCEFLEGIFLLQVRTVSRAWATFYTYAKYIRHLCRVSSTQLQDFLTQCPVISDACFLLKDGGSKSPPLTICHSGLQNFYLKLDHTRHDKQASMVFNTLNLRSLTVYDIVHSGPLSFQFAVAPVLHTLHLRHALLLASDLPSTIRVLKVEDVRLEWFGIASNTCGIPNTYNLNRCTQLTTFSFIENFFLGLQSAPIISSNSVRFLRTDRLGESDIIFDFPNLETWFVELVDDDALFTTLFASLERFPKLSLLYLDWFFLTSEQRRNLQIEMKRRTSFKVIYSCMYERQEESSIEDPPLTPEGLVVLSTWLALEASESSVLE